MKKTGQTCVLNRASYKQKKNKKNTLKEVADISSVKRAFLSHSRSYSFKNNIRAIQRSPSGGLRLTQLRKRSYAVCLNFTGLNK